MADAEEVDFDEQQPEETVAGVSASTANKPERSKATDDTGRRLKGRGAAGTSSTTMGDSARFDSMPSRGSTRDPLKCARTATSCACVHWCLELTLRLLRLASSHSN